ncbi:MAG: chromate efflux transporter [Pseudomonadota bacterium]
MSDTPSRPPAPTLASAVRYWLKLGFISFGGPAGQIALMHGELVERRRWISERRFLHGLNYCMLLPGPEATQLAIYIGWLMHGTRGGILAGALFVLPSLLILIALSWLYMAFGALPVVLAVLAGIKPAVVALVLAAAWRIGRRSLRSAALRMIAAAAFVAIAFLALPFPLVVGAAAAIGAFGARLWPHQFQLGGAHPQQQHASYGPALIDDDTPTPAHARFAWARLARTATVGCALGAAAWLLVAYCSGFDGTLARMGAFFSKVALLSFGGAYAVLPYVVQGGVQTYHWLSPAQMIDGLALGETTPGPLIMVNAFVGFAGGWNHAPLGPLHLGAAGAAGALVATFFTFLPSFVFVLAGGPLVEATRDDLRMTAPLTAISAAVVGVIASLALFFGRQVFNLDAPPAHWNLAALAIAAAALAALLRYQVGAVKLIGACAGAGLVLSYLH